MEFLRMTVTVDRPPDPDHRILFKLASDPASMSICNLLSKLIAFSDEAFDPKAWVNKAYQARPPEEPAEKYLSEIEMKLQLLAEDISQNLEEQSGAALLRVPRAVREAHRVKDDAVSLRGTVGAILQRLEQVETSSAKSVEVLVRVDAVKQQMEAAKNTLQYAAGLAQLSASVEEVFASGDLTRVADTLANMRRCLEVVGDAPEFSGQQKQLMLLEDRLEQMVQPRLSDALSSRNAEAFQSLRSILLTIHRFSAVEDLFCLVRSRALHRLWEEYEATAAATGTSPVAAASRFSEWLQRFFDDSLLAVEQEVRWCAAALPSEAPQLLLRLLLVTWDGLAGSFADRIQMAISEGALRLAAGAGLPSTPLTVLLSLHSSTSAFSHSLVRLLPSPPPPSHSTPLDPPHHSPPTAPSLTPSSSPTPPHPSASEPVGSLSDLLLAVFAAFEGFLQRYGALEADQLALEIAQLDLRPAGRAAPGSGQRGLELADAVRRVEVRSRGRGSAGGSQWGPSGGPGSLSSIAPLLSSLEAALHRCLLLSGGVEAASLISALDDALLLFCSRLSDCLASLPALCGVQPSPQQQQQQQQGQQGKAGPSKPGSGSSAAGGGGSQTAASSAAGDDPSSLPSPVEEEEEWALVQGVLQLLIACDRLAGRTAVFEASLRAALAQVASQLGLGDWGGDGAPPASSLDIARLRLRAAPERAAKLRSLLALVADPRMHVLPRGSQRVRAVQEAATALVNEVLISKVRRQLRGVAALPEWSAAEEDNAFELPTFNAYALPYVTAIGEYLLTLPQQLEPMALAASETTQGGLLPPSDSAGGGEGEGDGGGGEEDAGAYFVREWMQRAAEGATALFVEQLKAIPRISDRGAQQLSADIEYLCSILSVLYVPLSPQLATYQLCLSTPKDNLAQFVAQEANNGSLDMPTVKLFAKARGVNLKLCQSKN